MRESSSSVLLAGLVAAVMLSCTTGDAPVEPLAWPDSARTELVAMGRLDQKVRAGFGPQSLQDTAAMRRLLRTDSLHTLRLAEMIEVWGWPTPATAGDSAVGAAFLIVQHSPDHDFQKRMLPTLQAAAARGDLSASEAAMLLDRVLRHDGLPQRYGSQFSLVNDTMVMDPVENMAALDSLRAAVGMPPIAEYVRILEQVYRTPARIPR